MDLTWGEIQTLLEIADRAIRDNIEQHETTGFGAPVCAKHAAIRVKEACDSIEAVCKEEYGDPDED